jgi:hypothetical protein
LDSVKRNPLPLSFGPLALRRLCNAQRQAQDNETQTSGPEAPSRGYPQSTRAGIEHRLAATTLGPE